MNVSPQEKDKLRKRLHKLFEKEKYTKRAANVTSNQQPKGAAKSITKTAERDLEMVKNKKSQQQNKLKSPKAAKFAPMQNGNTKTTENQNFGKKSTKSKEKTKLQQKNSAAIPKAKNNKKLSPKEGSLNNNATISLTQKQKNLEKKVAVKKTPINPKQTRNLGNKSPTRNENPKIESFQTRKNTKIKSSVQQNNSVDTNINKNQCKKAKKRRALSSSSNSATAVFNKKQKVNKKGTQKAVKISHKSSDESDDSSLPKYENEYDVNHMTGFVAGGDSDSGSDKNSKEGCYWMQEENYSENDSEEDNMVHHNSKQNEEDSETDSDENMFGSDNSYNKPAKTDTAMRKYKEYPKADLKPFDHNNFSDSEEDNSDSEEDNSECYESDSFEEKDEHYSDYDEDDYEEEEDSYIYSSESDEDYSTDDVEKAFSYNYCYNEHKDRDYKLPKHIPEDLIIHKGTCSKRDLNPADNISFDSDKEGVQIIELQHQETVKIIKQPKAYDKEELMKMKFEEKTFSSVTFQNKESIPNDDDNCPKLVPIVDEDGFQLYNPNEEVDDDDDDEELENYGEESMEEYEDENMDDVSLGSEYTEIESDDADSLLSEDINEKYLSRCNDMNDSDNDIDEKMWLKKHKPVVIDATDQKCENNSENFSNHSENSLTDDIMQIPTVNLYKNVDLKTESTVLSTTIVDNKIDFSNDSFDRSLSSTTIELQESEDITTTQEDELKEQNEFSTSESSKTTKSFTQSISHYNTKFFNAFNSNSVIVLLKDPFYIYGTVRLTLLAGSMEVYGHTLTLNTEVEIFSPRGCSVIEISSLSTEDNISKENLTELLKLYEQQFALNDLKTLVSLFNAATDAVVLLKRNDERKKVVQQYKKFMNENVFPNIKNINAERPLYNSEYLLRCMINISAQEQKCLRLPLDWQQFKLTSKSRVMLAGGKSVGKSTLLRYLINRHLPQKVLLIDLDIGQPEVFIPQTVSCTVIEQPLLGPGFLLNLQPEISFAVGHTNIALCAHKYLSAVRSLIAYCKEQESFKDIPWLVNTMGYNKGFGLELISVLVQQSLTDVIQLQSLKETNNFESALEAPVLSNVPHILFSEEYERMKEEIGENRNYRLHIWPSAVQQESRYQKEWEMSAKDLRYAMLLARLSQALQGHADWLTDVKPLSASLNDLKIINLMDNTPLVSQEELEKSIEANLVYLCHYEEDFKPLRCLGIGVVRAIDLHVRHLYLIPALPYTHLKDINCLAIGEMPLPTSLFTNQGPRIKNIAPFVYNTVAASASKAIRQIYHRPAKFLMGKHKSLL